MIIRTITVTTLALSYDEIAGRLGIAVASARRLVHRKKWPKGKGNDGRVIVQVPVEFCEGRDGPADRGGVAARLIEDREARLAEWRRRGSLPLDAVKIAIATVGVSAETMRLPLLFQRRK